MATYRIGTDVGGTFTDFVLFDAASGEVRTAKVPTVRSDPSQGLMQGLGELGVPLAEVEGLTHGTTTATNALITREGPRTALLVTEGFRDTLEIRRANRQELFDAQWVPPPPLIRRRDRLEVRERLAWDGEVMLPLDEEQVADLIETLKAREIESVAIFFMNSYQHDAHEKRVKEMVTEAMPEAFVTASSEVSEEFREFERSSTVAANAFVGPTVNRYLRNLERGLRGEGLRSDVAVMQSNGGVCSIDEAATLPAKLARSGPAGGAAALQAMSELLGIPDLVGIDIGGTSADVSLVAGGKPRWVSPLVVEWGLPLLFPSVDVVSIGAGGGSIGWIDQGGMLQMGPLSAGADPGPACYGRGGTAPTSTDAHVVLGRLAPESFLGGEMQIDPALAEEAIREHVAAPLGLGVPEAAEGMLRILEENMLQAIRFVTVEKGYDPRRFTLVGYGGAGPLHVASLARELGMARAIVPVAAGVLSAWGMLTVDMVQDRSRTVLKRRRGLDIPELARTLEQLRDSIVESFARQRVPADRVAFEYVLDMQYYGQAYSMPVTLEHPAISSSVTAPVALDDEVLEMAAERFHAEHEREYGHADRGQEVQIVHARAFGRASVAKPSPPALPAAPVDADAARVGSREIRFDGRDAETAIYDRGRLGPGARIAGPAIVEEPLSTVVLPPGTSAEVDAYGNLVIATGA